MAAIVGVGLKSCCREMNSLLQVSVGVVGAGIAATYDGSFTRNVAGMPPPTANSLRSVGGAMAAIVGVGLSRVVYKLALGLSERV